MEEKEMIEEMAKVIDDRLIEANNYLGSMNKGNGYWIAQKLVEHYQPKIPEGSVVLSEEEYQQHRKWLREAEEQNLNRARKETAKAIFEFIKGKCLMTVNDYYALKLWLFEKYGVEE